MKKFVVGIAIGGTKTSVTFANLVDSQFFDVRKEAFVTNPNSDQEVLDNISKIIDKENRKIDAISVIVGSPLNAKKGTIDCPPHLPGFNKTPVVKYLKNKYKCEVLLTNDADACALAEYYFGGYPKDSNLIFCTFGTGFGAGLILNGKLYQGAAGMAGEIGHVLLKKSNLIGYGKKGSIEAFLAGGCIPNFAKTLLKKYPDSKIKNISNLTSKDIFTLARENDELCNTCVKLVAKNLGLVAAMLLDIFNPEYIVFGGIYPRNIDLLEKGALKEAKKNAIKSNFKNCKILASSLNEKIDEFSSLAPLLERN